MSHVYIIAEAGVNHNGSEDLAFKLIDAAYDAGADVVKFQTFKAKKLVTSDAVQAEYQIQNTKKNETQLAMLSRLELSYETHHKLISYCNQKGIEFLSTAFDSESLDFLVNDLKLPRLKIPSGEITNAPLVLEHARTGCDLIVSTGMATLAEVEQALGVIAFGYIADRTQTPSCGAFEAAYASKEGQCALRERVTLLHCTTEYPAPFDEINLRAMDTLKAAFSLPVGYSDHSKGISVPIAAVARGAILIEKHFTLDKDMDGPDHKASLEPDELKKMVMAIREVEQALGSGTKGPAPSEIKNKPIARKSIVAAKAIRKGEILRKEDIEIKRPGTGLSPYRYWSLLGAIAKRDYDEGQFITD
ncbi:MULTISPECIES: N-acetylneuraminate synthase [Pectobacterium]|uniref:N-acetylneuraminate synthase n=1 Tax=Pectobacterium TaxID=122277 RepID=UPI000DC64803|nr:MULTISPECIES: N-acetylneuraminate synthase [Pectobacterium]GKW02656.1 N-acetylneuraminate synthase [Pectobacterium carotovorum subsp. carotovorum]MCA5932529.1 N-acetylneuraminate synthase [Pectobacterium versatile]MCA5949877.1 N-acetylneuraminate synthase [Pectobacterium versatile]MCA5954132.1 N-acetylneuraminate synthase [Pectobacterium versatile]MCA6963427.1 N-acetylneuraminate synthase [Pectobacterium odoriferum]